MSKERELVVVPIYCVFKFKKRWPKTYDEYKRVTE